MAPGHFFVIRFIATLLYFRLLYCFEVSYYAFLLGIVETALGVFCNNILIKREQRISGGVDSTKVIP